MKIIKIKSYFNVDRCKEVLREKGYFIDSPYSATFISSLLAGYVKAVIMTPMDVITTRLYNQGLAIIQFFLLHYLDYYYKWNVNQFRYVSLYENLFLFYSKILYNNAFPHIAELICNISYCENVIFNLSVFHFISGLDAQGKGLYYNGLVDCAWKITKSEGLLAFYKGFSPSFLRQAPHSVLLLVFWDILKDLQVYLTDEHSKN